MKSHPDNTYLDWSRQHHYSRLGPLKWLTIITSSIIVGLVATFIDLSSVTTSDLRKGVCRDPNSSYAWSRSYSACPEPYWQSWSQLLFLSLSIFLNVLVNWSIYLVLSLGCGLAAVIITVYREPLIAHSGIPEISVVISGFNYRIPQFLGPATTFYKVVGLILVVASGMWLGKEGPMVHVACGLFSSIYSLFAVYLFGRTPNEALRRDLLIAAVAAGIASAFNSPVGGVLFVLESMPTYFVPTLSIWSSFVAATIALVVLVAFKVFARGSELRDLPLFQVDFGGFSWLVFETIPFIFLGIAGGVYGHLFIKLHTWLNRSLTRRDFWRAVCQLLRVRPTTAPLVEVATLVFITSICTFVFPLGRLSLNDYVTMLFAECPTQNGAQTGTAMATNLVCLHSDRVLSMILVFMASQGFFLAAWAFSSNLPGGILMPSLAIGASIGRLVGLGARHVQPALASCTTDSCIVSPSSHAVVGAAAFFTGISKMTVLVVVILFEMTGAVSYVLPIMILVMVAKFTNDFLVVENVYDSWLAINFNRSQPPLDESFLGEWNPSNSICKTNTNKGIGRVRFSNLLALLKSNLPNVSVKAIMIPIDRTRCLYADPGDCYLYASLVQFVQDDVHEGWPLLQSPKNSNYIGYVYKTELKALLESFAAVGDQSQLVSLIFTNLLHQMATGILVTPQRSGIVVNDRLPLVLLLEMFEKLHLNSLVIMDSSLGRQKHATGFVDRYILSRHIYTNFSGLQDEIDPESPHVVVQDFDETHVYDTLAPLL